MKKIVGFINEWRDRPLTIGGLVKLEIIMSALGMVFGAIYLFYWFSDDIIEWVKSHSPLHKDDNEFFE